MVFPQVQMKLMVETLISQMKQDEGISVQPVSSGKAGAVHKAGLLAGPRPRVSCGAGRILEEEAVCATGQVFSGYPHMD